MNTLTNFEVIGKRAFYRPSARVSFEEAVDLVAESLRQARELDLRSILVNTSGFMGMSPPSIFGRHSMAVKWAESAGSQLHVALVARPELIDPDKIGVLMAQNRGVSAEVFTTELAAIAWLDSRHDNKV
ncbi:MAG TPA: hypothetical protein VM146_14445 [Steroidobacteraceae bacterium]|nr:hypothetical protein [Steroidobacteraceae bacterium]